MIPNFCRFVKKRPTQRHCTHPLFSSLPPIHRCLLSLRTNPVFYHINLVPCCFLFLCLTRHPSIKPTDFIHKIILRILFLHLYFFCPLCIILQHVGVWLSLVERLVRDQEAGGSNPLTPTIFIHKNKIKNRLAAISLSAKRFFFFVSEKISNIPQTTNIPNLLQ